MTARRFPLFPACARPGTARVFPATVICGNPRARRVNIRTIR